MCHRFLVFAALTLSLATTPAGMQTPASPMADVSLEGDLPRRAALGFQVAVTDGQARVTALGTDGPAAAAGLREGDVLQAIDGQRFDDPRRLARHAEQLPGGQRVRLEVRRGPGVAQVEFEPPPHPFEPIRGVESTYGVVDTPDGARLRTILTRPAGTRRPLPAVYFVQWVNCETVEFHGDAPHQVVFRRLAERLGRTFIRVERSASGDSQGPLCHELDFDTELAHYRWAFDRLATHPWVDRDDIIVLGNSLGSVMAPLVADGRRVRGVAITSGGGLSFYERMIAFERQILSRTVADPARLHEELVKRIRFHGHYLLDGMTPEAIARAHPDLAGVWAGMLGTGAGTQWGRPIAFQQQAARKDVLAAWSRIDAPVLVVHNEYDEFETRFGAEVVVDTVNQRRPGTASLVVLPELSHSFYRFPSRHDARAFSRERATAAGELAAAWIHEAMEARFVSTGGPPVVGAAQGSGAVTREPAPWSAGAVVALERGRWFDGARFVTRPRVCIVGGRLEVPCASTTEPSLRLDLAGGYVVPPLGDAHTHHYDGAFGLPWQRRADLTAGVFYALSLTAPASGVAKIRSQFSGPANVDVATALGGITGPDSHPAEVYEALALGYRTFEEQLEHREAIRASRRRAGDAYHAVASGAELDEAWKRLIAQRPDIVKVFLRHSERYAEGWGKWGPGGGLDPALAPRVAELARTAGLRVAVATSSVRDFRLALGMRAAVVTHLPCYQDSESVGADNPYYDVDEAADCRLTDEDARAAARLGTVSVLIASEWPKTRSMRAAKYVAWEEANVAALERARAPLAVGSDAYGQTVVPGLIAQGRSRSWSRARLLRLATMDTPRAIFPARRVGCLEDGCEASLLVLDTDPLADLAAIERIRFRIKDGRLLSRAAIDVSNERVP